MNFQDKIIKTLESGDKSTAYISARSKRNYYDTLNTLNEMEEKGMVKKIKLKNRVYWRLKK